MPRSSDSSVESASTSCSQRSAASRIAAEGCAFRATLAWEEASESAPIASS